MKMHWVSCWCASRSWGRAGRRARRGAGRARAHGRPADRQSDRRAGGAEIDEAERTLASIDALSANRADALFARAQLAFYRGEYVQAVELSTLANAGATQRERRAWEDVSKLMLASRDVTAEYARKSSSDGRYVVLYPKGKDEVIAEDALEVLQAADRALAAVFGVQIPGPIRLEVYPSPQTLADVSRSRSSR